jgi:dTDP-4-dehydrorhamnose reductase
MMNKVNVLVLGSEGMLGHVVKGYLKTQPELSVKSAGRSATDDFKMDAEKFETLSALRLQDHDYIINCIGIIKPYCKDNDPAGVQRAIKVNSQFPWELSRLTEKSKTKVLQIATDCVYSGKKGLYAEGEPHDATDVYGKTKSLGEVFSSSSFLNIRCSIIGPEIKGKLSLLEWFLSQKPGAEVNGFSHHLWNGVTTLQFAKLCKKIMAAPGAFEAIRADHHAPHFTPNDTLSKLEMLRTFDRIYGTNLKITEKNVGEPVDRTLATKMGKIDELYGRETIESSVREIKEFARIQN